MKAKTRVLMLLLATCWAAQASAQSTVGELLSQGGKAMTKADFMEWIPARVKMKWPNRQGEEDLVLSADGTISGTGQHYSSRTESPAVGQWRLEDDGKLCTPKTFTAWNNSANNCWYVFRLGDVFYAAQKTDVDGRVGKIDSLTKAETRP